MAEDRHVERGAGRHEEHTLGDGAEESGENPVRASVGVGARGTAHMVGAILSPEDLSWPVVAILRRARERAEEVRRVSELQEAAPELAPEARTRFLQRERMEDKTPYAFRAALLALGREAYPLLGEGALDLSVEERLRELARKLRVALPSAVGTEISSSTVARKIQVFEEKQQWARAKLANRAQWPFAVRVLLHWLVTVSSRNQTVLTLTSQNIGHLAWDEAASGGGLIDASVMTRQPARCEASCDIDTCLDLSVARGFGGADCVPQ
ncbi:unnamed protein product [Lampetra fluviatilis]